MDLNPIGIAVPFFLVMIIIEALLLRRNTGRWIRLNDAFTDLSCGIGDQMLGLFFKPLVLFPYAFCFEHSLMRLSTTNTWTWVFGFLAVDLCYYFYHRCSHRMNFGWSSHVVHHQSEEYNLSVALRQPWFSSFFSWVFYLPLAVAGLPLEVFATSFAVNLLYQFWIHTETINTMGIAESFLNTPSHHRVHHGTNPEYLDKNYAGIFIIWDRLFGTFEKETTKPLYGTLKPIRSWNAFHTNTYPLFDLCRRSLNAPNWRDALFLWIAPPEWTPEGPYNTTQAFNGPDRGYDTDYSSGWRIYLLVQLILAAVAVGLTLTFEALLGWDIKIGVTCLLLLSVWTWSKFFEGGRYRFHLEALRVGLISFFSVYLSIGSFVV